MATQNEREDSTREVFGSLVEQIATAKVTLCDKDGTVLFSMDLGEVEPGMQVTIKVPTVEDMLPKKANPGNN